MVQPGKGQIERTRLIRILLDSLNNNYETLSEEKFIRYPNRT